MPFLIGTIFENFDVKTKARDTKWKTSYLSLFYFRKSTKGVGRRVIVHSGGF